MGRAFVDSLGGEGIYSCLSCDASAEITHLASRAALVSTAFRGVTGKAFLFDRAVNTFRGPERSELMSTGVHTIRDIYCNRCSMRLGWRYEAAQEESQQYKVGKVILEKALLVG